MITLDEAVESAKLSAGHERVLRQQHYEDLLAQLSEAERYPFTMALVELDIGTRTGIVRVLRRSGMSQRAAMEAFLHADPSLRLENRIVRAAMRRDAGWWDTLKEKIKEFTGWDDSQAEQYIEDEYQEPEPPQGEDFGKAPGDIPQTDLDVQRDLEEQEDREQLAQPPAPALAPATELPPEPDEYPRFEEFAPPEEHAMPVMHAVESSNLEAVGYDEEEGLLYISFKPKRQTPRTMYRYFNVTPEEFSSLLNVESKGKWFAQNIRNTKPYDKIDIGSLSE